MMNQEPRKKPGRKEAKGRARKGPRNNEPGALPPGIPIHPEGELSVTVPQGLKVILTNEAFSQLLGYICATGLEISCLGSVAQEGRSFRIKRFYLLKQAGSAAHTELAPEAVAELAERLLSEGKASEARSIRAWAHSHPGMGPFWSETDEDTCRTLVSDYLISLVVGKDFSIRCRIDLAGPVPLTLDHVPVLHETNIDEALIVACRQEVKEKISPEPFLGALTRDELHNQLLLSVDADSYCELCGNWHAEGRCPLVKGDYEGLGECSDWGDLCDF